MYYLCIENKGGDQLCNYSTADLHLCFCTDKNPSHDAGHIIPFIIIISVATEQTPDLVLRQNFLGTFGMASDQAKKLGLSQNKSIICMYENHQVIVFYLY